MKKILFGLVAFASLSLTACGGNLCDDYEDAAKDLRDEAEKCGATVTDPGEPTDAERDACKEGLDKCSDSDKDKLEGFLDCVKNVKSCSDKTAAEQERYQNDLLKCAVDAGQVSAACDLG